LVDEVDDVLVRVQRKGWVRGVPAGDGLVNLCNQWFETVPSLEVKRDCPVRRERRIRLEGPEKSDNKYSDISSVLPGGSSKRGEALCARGTTYKSSLL